MTKKDDFLEKIFEPALRKHGLKLTSPRRLIAERIFSSKTHFSADELVAWIQQGDAQASRATVYRTLHILEEEKIIEGHDFGGGKKQFQGSRYGPGLCTGCQHKFERALQVLSGGPGLDH